MNPKLKKILSALFILLSISAVVVIAFSNPEMGNAWDAISRLEIPWIGGLMLCWAGFAGFETLGNQICLQYRGYRISFFRTFRTVLIGMYYSSITPSSAGGQPMQVNALRKEGIPVEYGTLALTVRFVMNQFTVCMMTLVLFLVHHEFVAEQLGAAIWAARIGWLINFMSVPLVLLAAFRRKWIQHLAERLIRLGARMRLVRDPQKSTEQVTGMLDTYHDALNEIVRHPKEILLQLLCSLCSLLGLTGSAVFTYYALGQSGTPAARLLTLACLLFVSASYTPLPGASGAQEGGFLLYFQGLFRDGTIGLGLLIWRFFTYYLWLITGVGALLTTIQRRKQCRGLRSPLPKP